MRYICSQVSSEGSINESGYNNSVNSLLTAAIPSNTVATIGSTYPLKAIRKKVSNRDNALRLTGASVFVSSANDIIHWSIQLNPTLSAPLVYTDVLNSAAQEANGSAVAAITNTVTVRGRVLAGGVVSQNGIMSPDAFAEDYLQYLGCTLDNTMDELVLCVTPITSNITLNGSINFKEY